MKNTLFAFAILLTSASFFYIPNAHAMKPNKEKKETLIFGMGCFWCSEAIFQRVRGVLSVEVGYAGGDEPNPTYAMVCSHKTHYVEVSKIIFNPSEISASALLNLFFHMHDPTTLNRQGADVGEQYRSVIFYQNPEQKKIAEQALEKIRAEKVYDQAIVTAIEPLKNYHPAEDYHQAYYEANKNRPYCQMVISPKVAKLLDKYKKEVKADAKP